MKGYVAGSLAFSPDLLKAIKFADASISAVVQKLQAEGLYEDNFIIAVSKYGQAPIDPTKFKEVDPANFTSALCVKAN
jgi:predicted AlkP superfamily pyrophosphatase or phosphodiesterase